MPPQLLLPFKALILRIRFKQKLPAIYPIHFNLELYLLRFVQRLAPASKVIEVDDPEWDCQVFFAVGFEVLQLAIFQDNVPPLPPSPNRWRILHQISLFVLRQLEIIWHKPIPRQLRLLPYTDFRLRRQPSISLFKLIFQIFAADFGALIFGNLSLFYLLIDIIKSIILLQ